MENFQSENGGEDVDDSQSTDGTKSRAIATLAANKNMNISNQTPNTQS